MKRLAIIPARSGSKGLKDKNIKELNGKPLIAYSIEAALDSNCFDKVFVSTDSIEYAEIAKSFGADASFLRSEENSGDGANSWDVVREVVEIFKLKGLDFDEVMLLQPTSPLRNVADIKNAIELLHKKQAKSVVSLTECEHSPLWCNTLPEDCSMDNFDDIKYKDLPRQMLPKFYRYNGAIYLLNMEELYNVDNMFGSDSFAYIMPQQRSIDIDTELDFLIAETVLKSGFL